MIEESHAFMGDFDVLAFGASAGGIPPLFEVLGSLPSDFPLPVLVVQHLSSSFPTTLPALLQRKSRLKAKLAEAEEFLLPGMIYVAPPGKHLVARMNGMVNHSDSAKVCFTRPAVDPLFLSLAIQYSDRALAVILSGRGQDGSTGIRAIKGMGGMTIAQRPDTCEQPGMPAAAIETGCVDFVLTPEKIASALLALIMRRGSAAWFRSPATVG